MNVSKLKIQKIKIAGVVHDIDVAKDWNESDTDSSGYIINRTHYIDSLDNKFSFVVDRTEVKPSSITITDTTPTRIALKDNIDVSLVYPSSEDQALALSGIYAGLILNVTSDGTATITGNLISGDYPITVDFLCFTDSQLKKLPTAYLHVDNIQTEKSENPISSAAVFNAVHQLALTDTVHESAIQKISETDIPKLESAIQKISETDLPKLESELQEEFEAADTALRNKFGTEITDTARTAAGYTDEKVNILSSEFTNKLAAQKVIISISEPDSNNNHTLLITSP